MLRSTQSKVLLGTILIALALLCISTFSSDRIGSPAETPYYRNPQTTTTPNLEFIKPPSLYRKIPPIPPLARKDPTGQFSQLPFEKTHFTLWTQPKISFVIEEVLGNEKGWAIVKDPAKADLLWARHEDDVPWDVFNGETQWVNRVLNETVITTKGSLAERLAEYKDNHPDSVIRVPTTYLLYNQEQCQDFQKHLRSQPPSSLWIIKATHLSRGRGASVHTAEELLTDKNALNCDNLGPHLQAQGQAAEGRVVQEYISDPLLIDGGYKSELRWYWLVVTDPWMVLLYPNATVRKTSEKYSLEDLKNIQIHLANTYIQKKQNSAVDLATLKWSLEMLEEDLVVRGLTHPGWIYRDLYPRIIRYLYEAWMATREYIPVKPGTFVLFGADILLDAKLNMYLLEVQTNPGMSTEGVKQWIIPPLLRQTAAFLLELRDRKQSGASLCTSDLQQLGLFLPIYNEADALCSFTKG